MRLSTGMYCIIAVGLISDRLDHMKFGLPISMQATDTGSRLVCMMVKKGFSYLRAERFRIPGRVASGMSLFILLYVDRRAPFVDKCSYL